MESTTSRSCRSWIRVRHGLAMNILASTLGSRKQLMGNWRYFQQGKTRVSTFLPGYGCEQPRSSRKINMRLTQQQLEAHLWGAANILRGKTAGQDYKNYILSLMFYKRLCDQWENEADEAIAELERQQGRSFTDAEKAVFRKRGSNRYTIPDGSRWGEV